jgi:Tfp pilus assembly protein PilE
MGTAKARLQDSAGMTLVEVIIAAGIVIVGLVALIAAMPLGTSLIGESNLKTTATFLAQQRMEQIKNKTWTGATDTLGGAGSSGDAAVAQWPDETYNTIANYPRLRRQVRIQDCSVAPPCIADVNPTSLLATMRQVTVTLSFYPIVISCASSQTGAAACSDSDPTRRIRIRGAAEETVLLTTLITRRP